jgi:hypothetical protein
MTDGSALEVSGLRKFCGIASSPVHALVAGRSLLVAVFVAFCDTLRRGLKDGLAAADFSPCLRPAAASPLVSNHPRNHACRHQEITQSEA